MASKAISLSNPDLLGNGVNESVSDPFRPKAGDYVSTDIDGTPFERLLWAEIRRMEKKAHLTDWQAVVFEWYLRPVS
jgi:hypothetical protein